MRPGQNPKRARRGRGNKPHNFSNRTFDSNGPDVKIRGTAAHIYEKYQLLARDANASGDRVGAENYLQHAEHYYRILAAFNAQNNPNGGGGFNGGNRPYQQNNVDPNQQMQPPQQQRPPGFEADAEGDDDGEDDDADAQP